MEKKIGRPTDNPKIIRLGLRLAPGEAETLLYCANELKIPRTGVITKGIEMVKAEIDKKKLSKEDETPPEE